MAALRVDHENLIVKVGELVEGASGGRATDFP
jgi:hypothetical protein